MYFCLFLCVCVCVCACVARQCFVFKKSFLRFRVINNAKSHVMFFSLFLFMCLCVCVISEFSMYFLHFFYCVLCAFFVCFCVLLFAQRSEKKNKANLKKNPKQNTKKRYVCAKKAYNPYVCTFQTHTHTHTQH